MIRYFIAVAVFFSPNILFAAGTEGGTPPLSIMPEISEGTSGGVGGIGLSLGRGRLQVGSLRSVEIKVLGTVGRTTVITVNNANFRMILDASESETVVKDRLENKTYIFDRVDPSVISLESTDADENLVVIPSN